jgi:hypothetical protein
MNLLPCEGSGCGLLYGSILACASREIHCNLSLYCYRANFSTGNVGICVQEIPASNFGRDTDPSDICHSLPGSLNTNTGMMLSNVSQQPLLSLFILSWQMTFVDDTLSFNGAWYTRDSTSIPPKCKIVVVVLSIPWCKLHLHVKVNLMFCASFMCRAEEHACRYVIMSTIRCSVLCWQSIRQPSNRRVPEIMSPCVSHREIE